MKDIPQYTHETIAMAFAITEIEPWFKDTIRVSGQRIGRGQVWSICDDAVMNDRFTGRDIEIVTSIW